MIPSNARTGKFRIFAALAIAGLVIAGCGGDDAAEPTPTAGTTDVSGQAAGTTPEAVSTAGGDAVEPTAPSAPDAPTTGSEPAAPQVTQPATPQSDADATQAPAAEPEPTAEVVEQSEEPTAEPENPAPPFGTIDSWHNTEPLAMDQLRGSPVLLVFWADY